MYLCKSSLIIIAITCFLQSSFCKETHNRTKPDSSFVGTSILGGILGSVLGPDGLVTGGGGGSADGGFLANIFGGGQQQTTEDGWFGWSPSPTPSSKNPRFTTSATSSSTSAMPPADKPSGRSRASEREASWTTWTRLPERRINQDIVRERNLTDFHGFYISTKNSDLLDGVGNGDGDRSEESCLAKAEFRNKSMAAIQDIQPMRIKRELLFCDRMVLQWIVDSEPADISWKEGAIGCVYRPPDTGNKRLWYQSLSKSTQRSFGANDRQAFSEVANRQIKQARCGNVNDIQRNLFDVTIAKARCQILRKVVTQNRCNACELKAVLDQDGRLHRCVTYKLKATRSIKLYDEFMRDCVDDIAEQDWDLDC